MKNLIITILFSFPTLLSAQNKITVNFSNIKIIQGQIYVGLYTSEGDFMKDDENFRNCITPVSDNTAQCILENIPNGKYAISVFHDENGNGKLDTGMFGIPKEPYGFSNNARGTFGPPSFHSSSFEVMGDVVQEINL